MLLKSCKQIPVWKWRKRKEEQEEEKQLVLGGFFSPYWCICNWMKRKFWIEVFGRSEKTPDGFRKVATGILSEF